MTEGSLLDGAVGPRNDQFEAWHALLHAVAGGVDLPVAEVLQQIARAAREIVGCGYAVVAVVDDSGTLDYLVPAGDDPAAVQPIGRFPLRDGLLGAVIAEGHTVRLSPESGHTEPLLGVPIHGRAEQVIGGLYLAEPDDGCFGEDHERAALLVAGAAGATCRSARLAADASCQQRWLNGSARLTRLLVNAPEGQAAQLVVGQTLTAAAADRVALLMASPDVQQKYTVVAAAGADTGQAVGSVLSADSLYPDLFPVGASNPSGAEMIPSSAWTSVVDPQEPLATLVDPGTALLIPLRFPDNETGLLVCARGRGRAAFKSVEAEAATRFGAELVPALEAMATHAQALRRSLSAERDRIARDLHDHVIQRLFAIGLSLQSTAAAGDSTIAPRLAAGIGDLDEVIAQIRTTIYQLTGPVWSSGSSVRRRLDEVVLDLVPALGFRPELQIRGPLDSVLEAELADDCVAVVREALTNVARHAGATSTVVTVTVNQLDLTVDVADNGRGLDRGDTRRSGLANLRARAEGHGGRFAVHSGRMQGTRVTWRVPTTPIEDQTRSAG